jgi:hypothetical protein
MAETTNESPPANQANWKGRRLDKTLSVPVAAFKDVSEILTPSRPLTCCYHLLLRKNLAGVDGIYVDAECIYMLQYTVSKDHTVKTRQVIDRFIEHYQTDTTRKLVYVLVVPEDDIERMITWDESDTERLVATIEFTHLRITDAIAQDAFKNRGYTQLLEEIDKNGPFLLRMEVDQVCSFTQEASRLFTLLHSKMQ